MEARRSNIRTPLRGSLVGSQTGDPRCEGKLDPLNEQVNCDEQLLMNNNMTEQDALELALQMSMAEELKSKSKPEGKTSTNQVVSFFPTNDFVSDSDGAVQLALENSRNELNEDTKRCSSALYAGLLNRDSCCWFNSMIQALFYLDSFRDGLLRLNLEHPKTNGEKLLAELQKLFALLLFGEKRYIDPTTCLYALRQHRSTFTSQQDVSEFQYTLLDVLEKHAQSQNSNLYSQFYGGYTHVDNSSLKHGEVQQFSQFPINISHLKNDGFYQALDYSLKANILSTQLSSPISSMAIPFPEDSHMYFKSLPAVLMFELCRFSFDTPRARAVKLHDPLAFPVQLYLDRFSEANFRVTEELRAVYHRLATERHNLELELGQLVNWDNTGLPVHAIINGTLKYGQTVGATTSKSSLETVNATLQSWASQAQVKQSTLERRVKELQQKQDSLFFSDSRLGRHERYRLHAVVVHEGSSSDHGHYWAYVNIAGSQVPSIVRRQYSDEKTTAHSTSSVDWLKPTNDIENLGAGGEWLRLKDTSAQMTDWHEVSEEGFGGRQNTAAYCLLYVKHGGSALPVNEAVQRITDLPGYLQDHVRQTITKPSTPPCDAAEERPVPSVPDVAASNLLSVKRRPPFTPLEKALMTVKTDDELELDRKQKRNAALLSPPTTDRPISTRKRRLTILIAPDDNAIRLDTAVLLNEHVTRTRPFVVELFTTVALLDSYARLGARESLVRRLNDDIAYLLKFAPSSSSPESRICPSEQDPRLGNMIAYFLMNKSNIETYGMSRFRYSAVTAPGFADAAVAYSLLSLIGEVTSLSSGEIEASRVSVAAEHQLVRRVRELAHCARKEAKLTLQGDAVVADHLVIACEDWHARYAVYLRIAEALVECVEALAPEVGGGDHRVAAECVCRAEAMNRLVRRSMLVSAESWKARDMVDRLSTSTAWPVSFATSFVGDIRRAVTRRVSFACLNRISSGSVNDRFVTDFDRYLMPLLLLATYSSRLVDLSTHDAAAKADRASSHDAAGEAAKDARLLDDIRRSWLNVVPTAGSVLATTAVVTLVEDALSRLLELESEWPPMGQKIGAEDDGELNKSLSNFRTVVGRDGRPGLFVFQTAMPGVLNENYFDDDGHYVNDNEMDQQLTVVETVKALLVKFSANSRPHVRSGVSTSRWNHAMRLFRTLSPR